MSEGAVPPLSTLPLFEDFNLPDIGEIVKQDQVEGVACTNTRQQGARNDIKSKIKSTGLWSQLLQKL